VTPILGESLEDVTSGTRIHITQIIVSTQEQPEDRH